MACFDDIPNEILRPILLGAADKRTDLAPLRLVSTRANAILRTDFWHCVRIDPVRRPWQILLLLKTLQEGDAGTLVRALVVESCLQSTMKIFGTKFKPQSSRQWMIDNYSKNFADWLATHTDSSCDYILVYLVAHMPGLKSIDCMFSCVGGHQCLHELFARCAQASARRLTDKDSRARSDDMMPLMSLSRLTLAVTSHMQMPYELDKVMDFPLHHLQLRHFSSLLFGRITQTFLRRLDIDMAEFDLGSFRRIFTSFPNLEHLNYYSVSYNSGYIIQVDLNTIGNVLRQFGRKLRHLSFDIDFCGAHFQECEIRGQIGSLRELEFLETLAIDLLLLLCADDLQLGLVSTMPKSIRVLAFTGSDGDPYINRPYAEQAVQHLLQENHGFPDLDGIQLAWDAMKTPDLPGWKRTNTFRSDFYASSPVRRDIVDETWFSRAGGKPPMALRLTHDGLTSFEHWERLHTPFYDAESLLYSDRGT
ncbi:F-box/TPR repeat protein Pof3 [Microdochium nivale]|nr:F-box/TPR repeat protein Pof3 [Microdochium nivale]